MAFAQSEKDGEWAILNDRGANFFRRIWSRHQVLLMVLAALMVRLVVVAYGFREQTDPSDHHAAFGWEMGWVARSIFQGHGFSSPFFPLTGSTAMVPPLFPYLVAAMFHLFGLYTATAAFAILSINSLFSALTCIPLYFSARYALGEKAAVMAGWGWVIYPYAIYFSGARVWDYALTGLLFTTCFYFAQRLHGQKRLLAWLGFGQVPGKDGIADNIKFAFYIGAAIFVVAILITVFFSKEYAPAEYERYHGKPVVDEKPGTIVKASAADPAHAFFVGLWVPDVEKDLLGPLSLVVTGTVAKAEDAATVERIYRTVKFGYKN